MTLDKANLIIKNAQYYGDMTPFEEALLTLIMDLQVRLVEMELSLASKTDRADAND